MKGRILRNKAVENFEKYLYKEEKSENTIQKYLHDIRAFMIFAGNSEIAKENTFSLYCKRIAKKIAPLYSRAKNQIGCNFHNKSR